MDIVKHRTAGITIVRDMDFAVGEFPYQPGINRTEQKVAVTGTFLSVRYIIQYPADFCSGKVGIDYQTCFILDGLSQALLFQFFAYRRGTPALPANSNRAAVGLSGWLTMRLFI